VLSQRDAVLPVIEASFEIRASFPDVFVKTTEFGFRIYRYSTSTHPSPIVLSYNSH
jgi:hypothetical protein